ncbi:MAG: 4Fe-4S dicluster domain-containing protein [Dehalococcoidia bacterium]
MPNAHAPSPPAVPPKVSPAPAPREGTAGPQQARPRHKWGMVVDLDRCTGCQACVVACQAENNIPLNTEQNFLQRRVMEWIRIERYWDGHYPDIRARYIPIMCQQCDNAPCEPVCPVYATYHNDQGLNVQVYNRCVGTRYCANNCPYHARFFNFWQPVWPATLDNQLNPDVTVRWRGIMEKCTFCIQRIRRAQREALREGRALQDGDVTPACVQACPTDALVFGDLLDPQSRVSQMAKSKRAYKVIADLGTGPNVIYLKKVDPYAPATEHSH